MLHVAHVLYSLEIGGTQNGVVNLVRSLGPGFRHTVISMTDVGPIAHRLPREVEVLALERRPGLDWRAVIRLAGVLRKLRPAVVHSRNWGAFDAVPAARLAGARVVIHGEHGREVHDPQGLNRRHNLLRRALAPLVRQFVAVSHDLARWLVHVVGIPAAKVVTIHNGVDTAHFSERDRALGRRALGLPADHLVIGAVGRLDPVKDHLSLLEAFAHLRPGAEPVALVIVGDGPCRERLQARAGQPDLAGRVHLLGERNDVPALLPGLDVFVLPSLAEGISNTVLEAMASGLAVVATRTGGNPELVEDGVSGVIVPPADPVALATGIEHYLGAPERRARHGQAARRRAVAEFGLDVMASRYAQLYRALASVGAR